MKQKILDRYILKKFLSSFFFTALIFTLISVIIDLSDKVDQFINNQVAIDQVVTKYIVHFILYINGLLWPLFALISVIFFTSRLAKNSEIISAFNAGISIFRVLRPYLIGAFFITGVHLLMNHFLIPEGNKIRIPFENKLKNRNNKTSNHIHLMLDPSTKFYARNFNPRDSSLNNVRLETYEGTILKSYLEARYADWIDSTQSWSLRNYVMRSFDEFDQTFHQDPNNRLDTAIAITPTDIIKIHNQHQIYNSIELASYLNKQKARGIGGTRVFETELYRRSADPFSIIILAVIGFAVSSKKVRGGLGLHLAIGVALGATYIFLGRFALTFTNAEAMGPFLGVWFPNLFFLAISIYLLTRAQT